MLQSPWLWWNSVHFRASKLCRNRGLLWPIGGGGWTLPALTSETFPPQKTSPSHAFSVLAFIHPLTIHTIHLSTEPVNQSVSGSACSSVWQFEGLLGVFKQWRALNMEPFLLARNLSQMLHQHLFIKLVPARVNWLPLHKRWSSILTLLVLKYFSADLPQQIRQNASHPLQTQARSEDLNIIVNSWLSVFGLSLRQPFPPIKISLQSPAGTNYCTLMRAHLSFLLTA